MEERLTKGVALFVAMLAVFICTCLYYLPAFSARIDGLVARNIQYRRERQMRQTMLEELSGLEFLAYSTEQAMAQVQNLPEEEQQKAVQELDFSQQLRVELPESVASADVIIDNKYIERKISITIPNASGNYLVDYPMLGRSDHIEELDFHAGKECGTIELTMEHVYELKLDWQEQYLYIDFVRPSEIYDKIVVIDAGHGGGMPGAVIRGVKEKDIDLAIVKKLKALFEEAGDETLGVYYTRLEDENPSFLERSGLANEVEANLFVSIHNNSLSNNTTVHGTQVLYDQKKPTEGNSSKRLATILLDHTIDRIGAKDRGLVNGNDIVILRTAEMPSALIEVGFMTNPDELKKLTDDKYQKRCAQGIYNGILKALAEGF
ncbi:MAG: N-acetylmuramoyl-L-alanine amidase [bacterium]|nr:N-acetylmuramoyl-L-alanine amidase [bacterium]